MLPRHVTLHPWLSLLDLSFHADIEIKLFFDISPRDNTSTRDTSKQFFDDEDIDEKEESQQRDYTEWNA
jgi:hypothetical protein